MSRAFFVGLLGICAASACAAQATDRSTSNDEGGYDGDPSTESAASSTYQPGCTAQTVGAYALGGTILGPTGPTQGYVVVKDEKIVSVVSAASMVPAGTKIVETHGVIAPGLVDLHNHVAYDFLPLWNSGKRWQNRYQWAGAQAYAPAVKTPYNAVKAAGHMCEAVKYGEWRAIVGGTTTVQGSVDLACTRSWARNVEFENFCQDHVRQDVLPVTALKQADADALNAQFQSGAVKTFFVHLAEGIDDSSRKEFDYMRSIGLIKPQVVAIHATALSAAQIDEMGAAGMKIVWSPLSNLILYGQTTNIPEALKVGIAVSIAPDWSPSGSANVLGELKVADRVNKERFGGVITDQQLVQMATSNPAAISGLSDKIGTIAPGYYADLMVVRPSAVSPYRAVIDAQPADVLLTTVSGVAFYGDPTIVSDIGQSRPYVTVDACGTPRVMSFAEPSLPIPKANQSLSDVTSTFATDGVTSVIPLFQCTPAPEFAFH